MVYVEIITKYIINNISEIFLIFVVYYMMYYKKIASIVIVIVICICIYWITTYQSNEAFHGNRDNIIHLFWTGGYDSTFRLCQAAIDQNRIVQPYYIVTKLDNCKTCNFQRNNRVEENRAMENVLLHIQKKYPNQYTNIKPIIYVDRIPKNNRITDTFYEMNLHNSRRKYNQYEAMARYANGIGKRIEIGTVGLHGEDGQPIPTDPWGSYLRANLVKENNSYYVRDINSPVYHLSFPIAYLSKHDIARISKKKGYFDIVKHSWSCWFPKKGRPCGRCNMCRERII